MTSAQKHDLADSESRLTDDVSLDHFLVNLAETHEIFADLACHVPGDFGQHRLTAVGVERQEADLGLTARFVLVRRFFVRVGQFDLTVVDNCFVILEIVVDCKQETGLKTFHGSQLSLELTFARLRVVILVCFHLEPAQNSVLDVARDV